eukprot:TRINITY_DN10590_c0_g1_i1.p1 TRINITY_DN10590_c0_g1~~TRINITY_DN10590_c0_g1_i1.p1  ORF type:complete len:413 (-),score=106.03 TRINITY_DN10590_c0_g1_i1:467-1684(-)
MNPNSFGKISKEALFDAIQQHETHAVEKLLKADPTLVNATDENGWNALMYAAGSHQPKIFKTFIKRGARITSDLDVDGGNLLHVLADVWDLPSIEERNPDFIKIWSMVLEGNVIPINSRNKFGESPLHLACLRNNIWAVRLLLSQKDIDVNAVTAKFETPLHYASREGHVSIVKLLVDAGADESRTGIFGRPADVIAKDTKDSEMLLQLIDTLQSRFIIPFEIQLTICAYLTPDSLCALSQTCKMFHRSSNADVLWRRFAMHDWIREFDRTIPPKDQFESRGFLKSRWIDWIRYELVQDRIPWLRDRAPDPIHLPIGDLKIQSLPALNKAADVLIKILIIGDPEVGKSSFVNRFIDGTFPYRPTIGIDFRISSLLLGDTTIKLQIWDPRKGAERFRSNFNLKFST